MKTPLNSALARINELCEQNNWTHYRIAKEADIPLNSFNSMYKRNTYPTIPTLEKICDGFQISMKDFFDYDLVLSEHPALSKEEAVLVERYRELPKTDRQLLFAYLDGLQKTDFRKEKEEK